MTVAQDVPIEFSDATAGPRDPVDLAPAALRRADEEPVAPWNDGNVGSAFEPGNRVGRFAVFEQMQQLASDTGPSTGTDATTVGSDNFMLEVPVLQLLGRAGLNIDLRLTYNSRALAPGRRVRRVRC